MGKEFKISVLTATYNREKLLSRLYQSLIENSQYEGKVEWLIMDDGSQDDTKEAVKKMQQEKKIEIKYFYQENQGKMVAINQLVKQATGDLIIECDSDDYFTPDAFKKVKEQIEKYKNESKIYALCFLKYDQKGNNMGKLFSKEKTTMFDLYFKEGENGEKALVFIGKIRKQYQHQLEQQEKFVTEARMYHKMDQNYQMICINEPIMICEYQEKGYTKNIAKQFQENPYGYYQYFKEIFNHNMKNVQFSKRLYVIKHYILFAYLTKTKKSIRNVKGLKNRLLYILLYLPGIWKTKKKFKSE